MIVERVSQSLTFPVAAYEQAGFGWMDGWITVTSQQVFRLRKSLFSDAVHMLTAPISKIV